MVKQTPKELAERLSTEPIGMEDIRDSIASTLPRRWSEMILAIEGFRRNEHLGDIGRWVASHTHGRAFFHYQMICHFTPDLEPNVADFCELFDNDPKFRTAYHRMAKDWEEKKWVVDSVIPDSVIRTQMRATFDLMEFAPIINFITAASTFLHAQRNQERETNQSPLEKIMRKNGVSD